METGPLPQSTVVSGDVLHVGGAAGFSGDRTDATGPVVDALINSPGPSVLIFETLAERTLALAQLARRQDPSAGYEPLLDDLVGPVLARCLAHGVPVAIAMAGGYARQIDDTVTIHASTIRLARQLWR